MLSYYYEFEGTHYKTIAELAEVHEVSKGTVNNWIKKGYVKKVPKGGADA